MVDESLVFLAFASVDTLVLSSLETDDSAGEGSVLFLFLLRPQDAKTEIERIAESVIKNFFMLTSIALNFQMDKLQK